MSIQGWPDDSAREGPCTTSRQSWGCPNMKPLEGDTSMEYERYKCDVCGRTVKLDYEEMK